MSNDAYVWTAEQTATGFAQFSKAMELVREGLRKPERVSSALQAIISDDDIIVAPKIIQAPTHKVFHVTSDPKIRSAADAINALNCPVKWGIAETPAKIPMIIQPVDCKVRAILLGKVMSTEEIYKLYPKIVTPAEFFAFGAKFPEEQRKAPHFTIWLDAAGRFLCAFLDVGGDRRHVRVGLDDLGGSWGERDRVLVRE
jgi:hypothetical protein